MSGAVIIIITPPPPPPPPPEDGEGPLGLSSRSRGGWVVDFPNGKPGAWTMLCALVVAAWRWCRP